MTQSSSEPARSGRSDDARSVGRARTAIFFATMALGVAVVVAVGAELVARTLNMSAAPVQMGGAEPLTDEDARAAFEADPELFWRLRRNVRFPDDHPTLPGLVSNGQKLRVAGEIATEKSPTELRILFVGDSVTFGWGVGVDETFVARTGRLLEKRFPELSTVVINAGVPAYSLFQAWRYLEIEGFEFEPDVVVLGSFGFNDSTAWLGLSDFEQYERWKAVQPPECLGWSHAARLVARAIYGRPDTAGARPTRQRLEVPEFRDVLGQIYRATQAHGSELLVVVAPHAYNVDGTVTPGTWGPHQRVLGDFGETLRLGLLDTPARVDGAALLHALNRDHELPELMLDLVHPTPLMHAALAEEIAATLAPWITMQVRFGRFDRATGDPDRSGAGQ